MGIRGRQAAMMTRVMMQRAQFMMVIERMIEFMCGGYGSDQQQHRRQQPGEVSRLSPW